MNITESVHKILGSKKQVTESFYHELLTRYPELRRNFESRDMAIQSSMLQIGLMSLEAYYTCRFPAVGHYFQVLGNRHYHEGIRKEDYPKFRESLLRTLSQFHADEWNPELESQWADAIDIAIELMLKGYSPTFTI